MNESDGRGPPIFRENAIKKLHSLDQIESTFRVIEPTAWLWVIIAVSFFFSLGLWGVWGRVSTHVAANGIILSNDQFEKTEKQMREGIQQRQARLSTLKILLEKKRQLYARKYLNTSDMQKAEDEYYAAMEELINFSNKGYANTSMSVFSLTKEGINSDLCALVFVMHQEGKRIHTGMQALLIPTTLSAFKYGYIQGRVISISKYPVSKEAIYTYLGNMSLVDEFFAGGAPFMVKIKLEKNTLSVSGLSWTTRKGSPFQIDPGTSVVAKIIDKTSSPLSLLFKKDEI